MAQPGRQQNSKVTAFTAEALNVRQVGEVGGGYNLTL